MKKYSEAEKALNKPFRTPSGPKKFAVYVKDPKSGNVKIVRFGDPKYGNQARRSRKKKVLSRQT